MVHASLRAVPLHPAPPGWLVRGFIPGDEACWLDIQTAADRFNHFTPATFATQFAPDIPALAARQIYLHRSGEPPAGTVTAWFNDDFQGARWGRVHWLAVLPEAQRQGLGKALLSLACLRLRELGHEQAYLSTSTLRPAAIRLYRQFGFRKLAQ